MNAITEQDILRRVGNLPSLPTVVLELLGVIEREGVDLDSLVQKIEQDQALTAKTLRMANSSFYGMARQISTLQEAIAIVGLHTVRRLAMTAALMGTFAQATPATLDLAPFWRHALGAAVCARELAVQMELNADQAYVAGLLHDIGRLVLATQFEPQYRAAMAYRAEHDCSLLQAERSVLDLDHAMAAQALLQHWNFPQALQQAVTSHHAAHCAGFLPVTRVVMAADAMAHALDFSDDPDDLVPAVPVGLWQHLGLNDAVLLEVLSLAEKQFEAARVALHL